MQQWTLDREQTSLAIMFQMTSNGWQTDGRSQLNAARASGACTDISVSERKEWTTASVLTTVVEISQKLIGIVKHMHERTTQRQ